METRRKIRCKRRGCASRSALAACAVGLLHRGGSLDYGYQAVPVIIVRPTHWNVSRVLPNICSHFSRFAQFEVVKIVRFATFCVPEK